MRYDELFAKKEKFIRNRLFFAYNMAAVVDPRLRQLKIKTGVVKRIAKDKIMYEKEVVEQEKKIDKMKADGKCEHEIKKQIEVAEESKTMIPDCQRRLNVALEDLGALIAETELELVDKEEFKLAREMLEKTVVA